MLSITIGSVFILIIGYVLKKIKKDISTIESEMHSFNENHENDASLSYAAINKALENKQKKND